MAAVYGTQCCAHLELKGISEFKEPARTIEYFAPKLLHYGRQDRYNKVGDREIFYAHTHLKPFVSFSGVVQVGSLMHHRDRIGEDYARALADFITENGLGKVTPSTPRLNWTGNLVQLYLWEPDYAALTQWAVMEGVW